MIACCSSVASGIVPSDASDADAQSASDADSDAASDAVLDDAVPDDAVPDESVSDKILRFFFTFSIFALTWLPMLLTSIERKVPNSLSFGGGSASFA